MFFAEVDPAYNRKRLFIELDTAQTGSGFVRLDNFVLERGTVLLTPVEEDSTFEWSQADRWINADTMEMANLLIFDSFPPVKLVFPAKNSATQPPMITNV